MKRLLILFLFFCSPAWATFTVVHQEKCNTSGACASGNTAGSFSIATTGTAITITSTGSGNLVFISAVNTGGAADYITAASGGGSWTCPSTLQVRNSSIGSISGCYNYAITNGTTSVTLTSGVTSGYYLIVWEVSFTASSVTLDVLGTNGSNTASSSPSGQALTLTGSNDIIFQIIRDSYTMSAISSPYSNFLATASTAGYAASLNTTSGTAPTWTAAGSQTSVIAAVAIEEVVPTCASPVFGLFPKMYDSSLPQGTTVTSGCPYDCISFNSAPASSSPPICSAGTQITDGSTVTLPVGTNTLEAMGVQSGYVNSPVVTIVYNIQPVLSAWNGATVKAINGASLGTMTGTSTGQSSTGYYGQWNGTASVLPTVVTNFIDMHGGTNGSAPGATDLATSTYGTAGTWSTASASTGLTYSNTYPLGNLLQPVTVSGTVYNQTGTLGLGCVSSNSSVTATYCGHEEFIAASTVPSASAGFWIYTPNCNANLSIDCGADSAIYGGTDYVTVHLNPLSEPCAYNGIYFENKGGNSSGCLTYTNATLYRINLQENEGQAAFTATFSTSTPSITATQTLAANQAVQISTSGTLPTGIAASTTYYVLSTGLSGSAFEISLVQGGAPIQVTSTGSGTQTVTVYNQMTVCNNLGVVVGNLVAPSYTTATAIQGLWTGVDGEGPSVVGYNFYWWGYTLDTTGKFSATSCIL